jgi:hypothetical protein
MRVDRATRIEREQVGVADDERALLRWLAHPLLTLRSPS